MKKLLERFEIRELLKFCVGGGSAVIVDFLMYMFLKQYIVVSAAKTISFIMGAAVGFVINKLWTFESRSFSTSEIMRYILLYACSATANMLVNKGILLISSVTVLAFLGATTVSTIINFLGQKFFVFRKKRS